MFLRNFGFVLLRLVEAIISVTLTIFIVLPTFLILYLIVLLYRGVVQFFLGFSKTKIRLTTNGLDSIWGYAGHKNSRNVLNVVVYEGKIDPYRYRREFSERVLGKNSSYPRLREIFVQKFGFHCWEVDSNFNIENHVIILSEEEIMTEDGLMNLLVQLSEDMTNNHPQWQEVIVPSFKYDKNGGGDSQIHTVRILRFHHAYGDAGSWLLLYSHCMADGEIPYSVDPLKGFPIPSIEKFLYYSSAFIFGSTTMIRNIWYGTNVRSNRLVTSKYTGERFFAWTAPVHLQLLKEIKTRTRTSIPTVITTAIASALRRFDTAFPSPKGKHGIGELTDCGAVAAILPYPGLTLTNRFTIANLSLPTGRDIQRKVRLNLTHKACLELLRSPEPILNFWAFSYFGLFPIPLINFLMQCAGTSLVFSNLPGASKKFSILGDGIHSGGAWVPLLTTAGLTISAAGYRDGVRFCGSTDSGCMTKAQLNFILDTIVDEVNQMHWEVEGSV